MTCSFLDGPAAGRHLDLRTAPHFLRVVIDPAGKVDALDQIGDTPADDEQVHVYVMVAGTFTRVFACRGPGAGQFESGSYRYLEVDDPDALRERHSWVTWCHDQGNAAAVAAGLDPWVAS